MASARKETETQTKAIADSSKPAMAQRWAFRNRWSLGLTVWLGLGFWNGDGVAGGCHGASPWYLNGIVVNKPWLKYLKRFETGKRLGVLVGGFYMVLHW